MSITQISIFNALADKMRWNQSRQGVLAENVSNASTPGYRGSDLKPFNLDAQDKQMGIKPLSTAVTQPGHFSVFMASSSAFAPDAQGGFDTSPDGNGVTLEDQMSKISSNQLDFQAVTSLYTRSVKLLKTALGRTA